MAAWINFQAPPQGVKLQAVFFHIKMTCYYRYSYMILVTDYPQAGYKEKKGRYEKGKARFTNIHSVIFTFGRPKRRERRAVKRKAYAVYDELSSSFISPKKEIKTAIDPVYAYEARGIGFYYIRVFVNDELWGKTRHRRFRYVWKLFSQLVERFLS